MKVDRKQFLRELESCSPGLSPNGNLEQSDCFLFRPGRIVTHNDEIKCSQDTALQLSCAVPSKPILETLRKLTEEELVVTFENERLLLKCPGMRRVGLTVHVDVVSHAEAVDEPGEWMDVPPVFADALALVADSAAKDSERFALNCVRMTPQGMEATDAYQAIRYKIQCPVARPVLIKKTACNAAKGLGIAAMSETVDWIHWKTYTGLIISVRKYDEEFPSLGDYFTQETRGNLKFPASLVDSIQKAGIFMADSVSGKQAVIRLKTGKMMLRGQNDAGFFEEVRDIEYDGPSVSFGISPTYLQTLLKHDAPCTITEHNLRIRGDSFCWISSLEEVVA